MEVIPSLVTVSDRSAVGEVRRLALALSQAIGFDEAAAGRCAIVATELASNIVKHGESGHCFLSPISAGGERLVQIVAVDRGPGIGDPAEALRDGYSTAGTPGTGLGAVRRLSRSFDLYSPADGGVVVVARIAATLLGGQPPRSNGAVEVGAVEAALEGEPVSGDSWILENQGSVTTLLVTDGLGHGPLAADSSRAAISGFEKEGGRPPGERVHRIHESMRGTRGAAIAVAEIDADNGVVRFAGIGNIAAQIVAGAELRRLVSMNGIAGHSVRTIREFEYAFPRGALLVVHSDGVSAKWSLDRYPGVTQRDPTLIAAVLHRDFARKRDDSVLVVARHLGTPADAFMQEPW
jgi:anti-sigma regulatory factor (Ser/Thr protein kinase)